MPASPFNVWINILGSVAPSVTRSLTQVNRQLAGLQRQVVATNRALAGGLGQLFGLGMGLAGITGLVAGMKKAVDLSLQNEQIQEATLVVLKNQREIRHQNAALATQDLKTLNDQAMSLQQQTGLYKNIFERGSLTLAQAHLNVAEIKDLQYSMANVLAMQKMQGRSAEQMQETYQAVGTAIERGMGRSLSRQGIILTPIEQRLLSMNALVGNIGGNMRIIIGAMNRMAAGAAKLRMQTLTGQVDRALSNTLASLERIGNVLKPIGQRLAIIFGQVIPTIEPVVTRLAALIGDALKRHMNDIKDWIHMIQSRAIPTIVEWVDKGWKILQASIKWFLQEKEAVIGAISAIGASVSHITNPFRKLQALLQETQDLLF
jgi:hypothetical protein